MNETLQKLYKARKIISAAYEKFDTAEMERKRILNEDARFRKALGKSRLILIIPSLPLFFIWDLIPKDYSAISFMILAALVAVFVAYNRILKKKREKHNTEMRAKLEIAESIYTEGSAILNSSINEINFIPADYRYPLAVNYFIQCFRDSRVETMNEALSMFDEQLHRWKMENSQQQMINQQNEQIRQLNGIKREVKINTAATVANGFFNLVSKF